jgi:hypothetical protein
MADIGLKINAKGTLLTLVGGAFARPGSRFEFKQKASL